MIARQKALEQLAGILIIQGWKDFDVVLEADELRIDDHGGRAACTVVMDPSESVFHAHVSFPKAFASTISFTMGRDVSPWTARSAGKSFGNTEEAARWLLTFLDSGRNPLAQAAGA